MTSLTIALGAVLLTSQAEEMRLLRAPDIYGNQIVFTYAGDLWTCTTDGGIARRLTSHPGTENWAKFSPDGKWIAFVGTYSGNADIYVMPSEGGEPKRLTFDPEPEVPIGWTPDGKVMYVTQAGSIGGFTRRLWTVDAGGGLPQGTKVFEIDQGSMSPDGGTLAYHRFASHNFNWRRYRGGSQGKISFFDLRNNAYSEIPSGRENSWFPMWIGDGVFFISDKNQGTVNLYRYDTKSKRVAQVTKFDDADIKNPGFDDKSIVFERNGYLSVFDVATGSVKTVMPKVLSDKVQARETMRQLGDQITGFSLSPSGNRIFVEARGELFSVPAKNGDTRNVTETTRYREQMPTWSPDGKTIAYLSDETGEKQIYLMPQRGGERTKLSTPANHRIRMFSFSPDGKTISYLTEENDLVLLDVAGGKTTVVHRGRYGSIGGFDWSPDSNWIAFIDTLDNLQQATFLYEVKTGKTHQVTDGMYNDSAVAFDLNGKYLYIVSERTFIPQMGSFEFQMQMAPGQRVYLIPLTKDLTNPLTPPSDEEPEAAPKPAAPPAGGDQPKPEQPKPEEKPAIKIDLGDMTHRAIPLPWPPGQYGGLVGLRDAVLTFSGGKLMQFSLQSRQSADIIEGARMVDFNPARTKIAYMVGNVLGISDLRPGIQPPAGRVDTSGVTALVNPKHEWEQIFWEAWRYMRDRFYDPNFAGVDWNAVGKRYAQFLPHVAHRQDLNYVLGLMIGELGTGHAYVGGGDNGPLGTAPQPQVGSLGVDFEGTTNVRFGKIYRGYVHVDGQRGPLAEPGLNIKEGDYLLEIDGKPVGGNIHPSERLIGKAGRLVTLTVNDKPSKEGSRKVQVRTIASDQDLRYIDWVEENRRKVDKASNGQIGYMHVPNTSMEGVIGFIRGFYSQSDKKAWIIDERFNGGGMIPTFFIEKLARRSGTAFRQRNGGDIRFPAQALDGPKAMLINGYAGSGGDMLPWLFREAKLGPLIGKRTWGGLVGITGSAPLVDGGFFTAPEFGIYDLATGKWIAENTGVDPDIDIDARPDLIAKGEDPQLEKAIQYLMDQLSKTKRDWKQPTAFPKTTGGG